MNESHRAVRAWQRWSRFWFSPAPLASIAAVRGALCLLTALYFCTALWDAAFWYGSGGVQASWRVTSFLVNAGLEHEARSIVSPLFLTESLMLYRAYLLVGIGLCLAVAAGKGGRAAGWLLWLVLVGWANRAMLLGGLSETLLSLALFALAIAPPAPLSLAWREVSPENARWHWSTGFARRLLGVQVSLVGLATTATMLASPVWWNGLGALALASPAEDRTIDWTGSALADPLVHDLLTHFLVLALPIGFALAWRRVTATPGRVLLGLWCLAIALVGSYWLYAGVFAAMTWAIGPPVTMGRGHLDAAEPRAGAPVAAG